ncbi:MULTISPECIES: carboxylating nicotinate-nucleotide diphosphorylase [unclassified Methylophaga]|jgi:nicotinate-nucleotide pyrophosphorylase (carboxylating)|uniref:carboxylating nicotinate-nucleotide diphosphorylase n=1 Tax=unclassified Methylophaga TaxID=2629249 RepID=UPI000C990733|nr:MULTISPECIES: carboxylating nicotinate-nucleotide diphosphorylase [unclassified Methylophaga]MAY16526.1 nicotinate-nucleotide diphosphorylase (carboxylating) [Methylophaga sp.]MBN44973.1 nicotinate-nucleotide diphosphorylase (carboxylating) [Methylophaga sp.]HAO25224.1 carboxylating nicotinate-nucleotide diphosphorylase [Methylophaga sp.]HCD05750.1 carboxylating nicotinate-nucleotide diphosphorylase [Methylophaga sp.]|tara:strand:- start:10983 stop:11828 length:846 start_codon:yes stop_codon:yes gene_type:complete
MTIHNFIPANFISSQVKLSLLEDLGQQDLTADLIPVGAIAKARLISRQTAVLCGQDWFNEVFNQLDPDIQIHWFFKDADLLRENAVICELSGNARALLSGERTAMNFLQTFSGTATQTKRYADLVQDLPVKLLDTRKTLPGLRLGQKYAVRCGGGVNHRFGLYDAILIKENHILATGSIAAAVAQAKALHPNVSVEVEVESMNELEQALNTAADIVLLDNFSLTMLREAVSFTNGKVALEASGGVSTDTIRGIAETGVDRISVGQLTKDLQAVDLSMRFID